tara:strand:+ start:345 stop:554 length:210 start_codon:yes stop_codon:yes gene_type:complete
MSTFKSDMKNSKDVVKALNKTGGYKSVDTEYEKRTEKIKKQKQNEQKKNENKTYIKPSAKQDLDRIFMM